ncbi:MAG TPA: ice-binding family protein [Jatrophihabitans sp.]|uniref:ice-binding family protein n=1 Tax=Jatrophihabitans sp. TaxID=1932789 RepID=UPI002DFE2021|nr:ice-binding family protein [Jatrophihabitans sp.]
MLLLVALIVPSAARAASSPVGLGTAAPFSVLGASTVTNTGPTTLSGDLGVSPGTAITGFPPGLAAGTTHAADAPAAQAASDLGIGYNDAAGRASTAAVAGDLVGRTLIDGVYTSSGPLALSGTVTFDGQGDRNSVFIVQIAKTLITASASHVATINGAQACHIFWQVGSSATLGTASTFQGTIMAMASISVTTSAHVKGRALARMGAVTLDNNVFTSPDCSNATPPSTPASTATTITSMPATATSGSSVTVVSTVTSSTGTPTGIVTVFDHGHAVGTGSLDSSGHARVSFPAGGAAPSGVITVQYGGAPDFAPSVSRPRPFTVTPRTPATTAGRPGAPTTTGSTVKLTSSTTGTTTVVANTGTPVGGLLALAAALLLVGGNAVWLARRRLGYLPRHRPAG